MLREKWEPVPEPGWYSAWSEAKSVLVVLWLTIGGILVVMAVVYFMQIGLDVTMTDRYKVYWSDNGCAFASSGPTGLTGAADPEMFRIRTLDRAGCTE